MKKHLPSVFFYALIILFLGIFLLYPVAGVFKKTFYFNNTFSFRLFTETASGSLVIVSIVRSLLLGTACVILTSLIAFPLAMFVSRYDFKWKKLASGLILIPMIMPPFVGAIGLKRLFARYGMINMMLGTDPFDWLESTGFWGVAFLQALHLFPIMYLNVTAALANIDPSLEEAASGVGASRWRVFRDVTLRLVLPGFFSGAVIVFLWSFTDLGTPLILGYRKVLAIEIFDRVTSINNDPTGPAMVVLVIFVTIGFLLVSKKLFAGESFESASKGYKGADLKIPGKGLKIGMYLFISVVLLLSLLPHLGLILTSVAGDWFMTALPSDITLRFFGDALSSEGVAGSVRNSVLYSSLSTFLDIVLGFMIAWFLLRRKIKAGWLVDAIVMMPIALPGLILAFGYVAAFSGTFLDPMKNPVPLLIIGYAVRRLPFCFRAAYAGLQQVGVQYEEASRNAGAGPVRTMMLITAPLIGANLIAGGILSFMFAMLEVSESMVLAVRKEFFPLTREIYNLLGKIPDGDYVASALGVIAMLFLAAGLITASLLMGKRLGRMFRI